MNIGDRMTISFRGFFSPGNARALVCALFGRVFLALGRKATAATVLEAAGEGGGARANDCLKRAMQLCFELGDDDRALAIANRLRHQADNDPDIAFVLVSTLLKRDEKSQIAFLQRPLLKSRNISHISLGLTVFTLDMDDDDDYELLNRTARFLEGEAGGRVCLAFLSALLVMWALKRCDYPLARRYLDLVGAELGKGYYGVLGLVTGFLAFHWLPDEHAVKHALGSVSSPPPSNERARRRAMRHRWDDNKIRLGYVSADFCSLHATMKLLGNVLERHDRERFEVTLFCNTPEEYLSSNAFDRARWGTVVDIRELSDEDAVARIRERNIDILVDLKGYTADSRCKMFNLPAAPVHVAWLGYPTTAVNIDLDYVIGDPFVLPDSARPDWGEVFCRLPETYQPNDPVHRPRSTPPARADFGLPPDRFVYASFNAPHKITPRVIDLWCRILRRTPDSVIWLFWRKEVQKSNLLREFARQGVAAERVLFMRDEPYGVHLRRIQLADIGLDTFPCNGHTTTSEQLWSGLPVVTVKGTHFASRVSESLLNAIGLPELVADDHDAYVELAVALHDDRDRLAACRRALEAGRFTRPLFDAERFCRHLETAYTMMAGRAKAGLEPEVIDVPALPPREGSFEGL